MKKTSKWERFFTALIYTILLTIPLLSVFARTIYVQSNPNAKDSYSGERTDIVKRAKYNTNELNSLDDFVDGNVYCFSYFSDGYSVTSSTGVTDFDISTCIHYSLFLSSNVSFRIDDFWYEPDYTPYSYVSFYSDCVTITDCISSYLNDENATEFIYLGWILGITYIEDIHFYFIYSSDCITNFSADDFNLLIEEGFIYASDWNDYEYVEVVTNDSLDNAFEYSMQQVVNTYGKGNINFVNWFGSMFFTDTNSLYFNFVNMYLNYALYISACYLLYLVLAWFIKFVTHILNNSFLKRSEGD